MKQIGKENRALSRRQWLKAVGAMAAGIAAVRLGGADFRAEGARRVAVAAGGETSSPSARGGGPAKPAVGQVAKLRPVECTQCDSCMPCGYGVDIPGNFRVYNELLAQDAVPDIAAGNTESSAFASKARRFLRVYDRSIPDAHQSQRCIKCFHCVSECPSRVFIVNELQSITAIADALRDWECTH